MTAINFTAINSSDAYIKQESESRFDNREIHRFILKESISQEVLHSAANAITSLLRDNSHLLFVSKPTKDETLQQKIKSCQYLIINGDALCLSNKPKTPKDIDPICQDMFFSEALIDKPVQCSKGRSFEETYIRAWVELRGNVCPCSNHKIGPIEVDSYVLGRIRSILTTHRLIQDVTDDKMIQDTRITTLKAKMKSIGIGKPSGRSIKIVLDTGEGIVHKITSKVKEYVLHAFSKQISLLSAIFPRIPAPPYQIISLIGLKITEYVKAALALSMMITHTFFLKIKMLRSQLPN